MEVTFSTVADGLEQDEEVEMCVILTGNTEVDIAVTLSAEQDNELPFNTRANGIILN